MKIQLFSFTNFYSLKFIFFSKISNISENNVVEDAKATMVYICKQTLNDKELGISFPQRTNTGTLNCKIDTCSISLRRQSLQGISPEDNLALDFQCKTILHWISHKSILHRISLQGNSTVFFFSFTAPYLFFIEPSCSFAYRHLTQDDDNNIFCVIFKSKACEHEKTL